METIFKNSGVGYQGSRYMGADAEDYEQRVRALIEDSEDFERSWLAGQREENQAYYNGLQPALDQPDEGDEQPVSNRSTFISTDVRDTILTIMPSLMRIFTNLDEKVAEFVPRTPQAEELAQQCYDYINYIFFNDNQGFLTLHSVFKDALTVKYGVTKWWTDYDVEVKEHEFTDIHIEQAKRILFEYPDVQVVDGGNVDPQTGLIDYIVFRYVTQTPVTKVCAVPPDEFRIARDAKNPETAGLVGHVRIVPISELAAKGYDPEELTDYLQTTNIYSDERFLRNPGLTDDAAIEGVLYGEWYIRIDADGDGIAELRHICTIGGDYRIIHDEMVPYSRFAMWSSDPTPHTAVGDCSADITKDIQRIKTNMIRGQLDNLAEVMNPRTVVNELVTNLEDILNDEVGAIIRTRGDPNAAVSYTRPIYAGAEVQTSIDYLDNVRASRTGVTEASKGLDPAAMQSTSLVGINAIIVGAQERIELAARILAETGLRPTLIGLLREITDHPNRERVVKLRGKWVEVDPSLFDPSMTVQINPSLGKGTDTIRLNALMDIEAKQTMIMEKFGVANPIVSVQEWYNTQEDKLKIANIRNVERYFKKPTPEVMQSIQNAPKEPSPEQILAQAQMEEVKRKTIATQGELKHKDQKALLDAKQKDDQLDFQRDELLVNASLQAIKIMGDQAEQFQTVPGVAAADQPGPVK